MATVGKRGEHSLPPPNLTARKTLVRSATARAMSCVDEPLKRSDMVSGGGTDCLSGFLPVPRRIRSER